MANANQPFMTPNMNPATAGTYQHRLDVLDKMAKSFNNLADTNKRADLANQCYWRVEEILEGLIRKYDAAWRPQQYQAGHAYHSNLIDWFKGQKSPPPLQQTLGFASAQRYLNSGRQFRNGYGNRDYSSLENFVYNLEELVGIIRQACTDVGVLNEQCPSKPDIPNN